MPTSSGAGNHYLVYEYRSADRRDATPTNSYAVLAWASKGISTASDNTNYTAAAASGAELYADVAWLGCTPGAGVVHGLPFEAGFASVTLGPATNVDFGARFAAAPFVFAAFISAGRLSAHLRLLEASEKRALIATEYDTCMFVANTADHLLAWIVTVPQSTIISGALDSSVSQRRFRPTRAQDVAALLIIQASLGLPDYLLWRNGSDPCSDRWAGAALVCHSDARDRGGDGAPAAATPNSKAGPHIAVTARAIANTSGALPRELG